MSEALEELSPRTAAGDGDFSDMVHRLGLDDLLDRFTDDDYMSINKAYRSGKNTADVEAFNTLFKESAGNYSGNVLRATWVPTSRLNEFTEGAVLQNDAILSTTKGDNVDGFFDLRKADGATAPSRDRSKLSKVVLDIDNSNMPQYDITEFSRVPEEEEVLIAPKSVLQVQDVYTVEQPDGPVTVVQMNHMHPEVEDIINDKHGGVRGNKTLLSTLIPLAYIENNKGK